MKKKIVFLVAGILLIGVSLYAAGDLTVTGNITANKKFQAGQVNNQNAWVTVTFPTPFDTVPVVVATGIWVNTSQPYYFVQLRNVTATKFEFRAINHGGGTNTATTNIINWIAFAP